MAFEITAVDGFQKYEARGDEKRERLQERERAETGHRWQDHDERQREDGNKIMRPQKEVRQFLVDAYFSLKDRKLAAVDHEARDVIGIAKFSLQKHVIERRP